MHTLVDLLCVDYVAMDRLCAELCSAVSVLNVFMQHFTCLQWYVSMDVCSEYSNRNPSMSVLCKIRNVREFASQSA